MAQDNTRNSIAEHKCNAGANAARTQMPDHSTRENSPRQVVTDLEARQID
jgi:hypothetical protein